MLGLTLGLHLASAHKCVRVVCGEFKRIKTKTLVVTNFMTYLPLTKTPAGDSQKEKTTITTYLTNTGPAVRQRATATRPFIAPSRRRACPSPCFLRSVATVGSSAATTWLCRASLQAPIDTRTASRRSRVVRNTLNNSRFRCVQQRGGSKEERGTVVRAACFQSTSVHVR